MEKNTMLFLTPKNQVIYLTDNMTIRQGLEKMMAHSYSAIPIISEIDGTYKGVVTEGDFLRELLKKDHNYKRNVMEIVGKKVLAAKVDTDFEELLEMIVNQNFVPIVDDRDIMMGIITRKSIINALKSELN